MATKVVKITKPSALETLDKFTQMFGALKDAQQTLMEHDNTISELKRLTDERDKMLEAKDEAVKSFENKKAMLLDALERAKKEHADNLAALDASYVSAKSINDGKMAALDEELEAIKMEISSAKQRANDVYGTELSKAKTQLAKLKKECSEWETKRNTIVDETTALQLKLDDVKGKLRTVLSLNT